MRKLEEFLRKDAPQPVFVGREALRALLNRHQITFQHTTTWKESARPGRRGQTGKIGDVLDHHPGQAFAFDEFGPLSIRSTAGTGWALQNFPDRLPANYHRTAGVRYFHGCYSVGDDTLWGVNREHKGTENTLGALQSIRASDPGGENLFIIMDNLPAHTGQRIRRWAQKHAVELCFTPTYSSWADPIEAPFGPLRQFTITNSNHPNHTVQTRQLQAYLRWRNAHARSPEVLSAQRRERARIRSEKGHHWGRHDTIQHA